MDSWFIDHPNLNPGMVSRMVTILAESGLFNSHITFAINDSSNVSEINFGQYPILRSRDQGSGARATKNQKLKTKNYSLKGGDVK